MKVALTWVHDVVSANGTVVDVYVYKKMNEQVVITPSPKGDSVPLFDLKALLDGSSFHTNLI